MLAHRAGTSGNGCTAAIASSFLMSSLCPTRLWKEIKKRGKSEGKREKREQLHCRVITITPFHAKNTQQIRNRREFPQPEKDHP